MVFYCIQRFRALFFLLCDNANMSRFHAHKSKDHIPSNPYLIPFIWISAFAVVELAGGVWTKSLALLGDAGHMSTDMLSLGLAMLAHHRAGQSGVSRHSSGHAHAEIYASIINVVLMLTVVVLLVNEVLHRFEHPQEIAGGAVMLIAFIGLVVNIIVAKRMHNDAPHLHGQQNLNHRAAFLHVLGDLLGSVAALAAGAVVYFTGWVTIDPILSLFISALILFATMNLIRDIWHTLHAHAD